MAARDPESLASAVPGLDLAQAALAVSAVLEAQDSGVSERGSAVREEAPVVYPAQRQLPLSRMRP